MGKSKADENNGQGRQIRLITEPGAFGNAAYMVVVRTAIPKHLQTRKKKINVESFIVLKGEKEEGMNEILKFKNECITRPDFVSFTILDFVEETRPLAEPGKVTEEDSPIVRPTPGDIQRFKRG